MPTGIKEIVHIIPLGHEYDRAVRPFDTATANRVYLIVDSGKGTGSKERDEPLQKMQEDTYTPRVTKYLENKGIEVKIIHTETFDLTILLKTITHIIKDEQDCGNTVLINMSSSGKLGAAAATLAGMAHGVTVYYVHADRYSKDEERITNGLSVCTHNTVSVLPKMDILLPDDNEMEVLKELYCAKEEKGQRTLSASELSEILIADESGVDISEKLKNKSELRSQSKSEFESQSEYQSQSESNQITKRALQSRNLMRVGGLMRRMEEKGYVSKGKSGRKMMYEITERGTYALLLSGVL